jgi:4a-hydroxytetrahydrobiopterin dehydratase
MVAVARPARLPDPDVAAALTGLPGWARVADEIVKTFELDAFADAIAFVVRVGFLAEKADHHPDLDIRWRRVRVALTTHDAGGLTQLDIDLARAIDQTAFGKGSGSG